MLFNLPVAGLPKEYTAFAAGQYWLGMVNKQDADKLSKGFLARLPTSPKAALLCDTSVLPDLLTGLPSQLSTNLQVYTFAENSAEPKLATKKFNLKKARRKFWRLPTWLNLSTKNLAQEFLTNPEGLQKLIQRSSAQIFIVRASVLPNFKGSPSFLRQQRFNQWLKKQNKTLVLLVDGLEEACLPLTELTQMLQGWVFLARRAGALDLNIFLWINRLGLFSGLRYPMQWQDDWLQQDQAAPSVNNSNHSLALDAEQVIFQQASLSGLALLSSSWQVVANQAELIAAANTAQSATLVFAVTHRDQVEALAKQLHQLRVAGGNNLKLIVREVAPCLRYKDQRLLLLMGASLILPLEVSNQSLLVFLTAVQGLQWHRSLTLDADDLLSRLDPPELKGLVSPDVFVTTISSILANSLGEVSHQLLELELNPRITPEELSSQLHLRRFGDLATMAVNTAAQKTQHDAVGIHASTGTKAPKLYLFLFACPEASLNQAVRNVFKLPLQDLFVSIKKAQNLESFSAWSDLATSLVPVLDAGLAAPQQAKPHISAENPIRPQVLLQPKLLDHQLSKEVREAYAR